MDPYLDPDLDPDMDSNVGPYVDRESDLDPGNKIGFTSADPAGSAARQPLKQLALLHQLPRPL